MAPLHLVSVLLKYTLLWLSYRLLAPFSGFKVQRTLEEEETCLPPPWEIQVVWLFLAATLAASTSQASAKLLRLQKVPTFFFASYDSSGQFLWAYTFGSTLLNSAPGITVNAESDGSRTITLTGALGGPFSLATPSSNITLNLPTEDDLQALYVAKFSLESSTSTPTVTFAAAYGTKGFQEGIATAIDSTGATFVTGSYNSITFNNNVKLPDVQNVERGMFLVKFNSTLGGAITDVSSSVSASIVIASSTLFSLLSLLAVAALLQHK